MDKEDLKLRTKSFAHRCVKLAVSLTNNELGNHIKKQLIRFSTSVTANYRAACHGHTRAAFIHKISIVIEEADESEFWLEFIIDEKLKPRSLIEPLQKEAHELASIFVKTRITAQKNL